MEPTVDLHHVSAQDLIRALSPKVKELAEKEAKLKTYEERFHELSMENDEVVEINAGGEFHSVGRSTLCLAKDSFFALLFSGSWDHSQKRDSAGRVFLDIDPYIFKVIVNFLRQKRIEKPNAPVHSPIISTDKLDAWHRSIDYYGLREYIYPDNSWKIQSLSREGKISRTKLDIPRGYLVRIEAPILLRAVLVGLEGNVSGVSVVLGREQRREEVIVEPLGHSYEHLAQEEDLTHVAHGFAQRLDPPEFFIMVQPNTAQSGKYRYVDGDNLPRFLGDLSVISKGGLPLTENSYALKMTIVYELACRVHHWTL